MLSRMPADPAEPSRDSEAVRPTLTLQTLGAAGLYATGNGTGNGEALLGPGKPLALLIFLAFAPGRQTSRETLLDLLWSDLDSDRGRRALRQTLFHLRRLLGGDEAIAGAEELRLTVDIDADRDRFLRALDHGDIETATATYAGDFLPAFGVPGGAAFEHWADLERERLRGGFLRGAELLVRRLLNASRVREAREHARRVRDLVPDVEAAGRLLLECAVASRDFVSATMEADAIEQWATAAHVVLEPGTRAAIARARRLSPTEDDDRTSTVLAAELTGREQEFFAITTAWGAVRTGPARHVHLTAPAGFGKTRLLRDAVMRLSAGGATVVSSRGAPGDRDVPYAFVGDLAAALVRLPGAMGVAPATAATLLALNPALSTTLAGTPDTATGEEALRRRIHALTDLVHSVADEQRFVLAIDDLHWIDARSFRVLEGLWGRLAGAHVLCLTASRPERAPSSESCTTLPLSPLSSAQVGALVAAIAALPPGAPWANRFVEGLQLATRGSPLLVLETLRVALDQGIVSLDEQEWRCHDEGRLASLLHGGEALRERVRALPAAQLWLLAVLATAGTPFERNALASLLSVSRDELSERLDPLERHGLVTRGAGGWIPSHEEIGEAARAALGDDGCASAERTIAEYYSHIAGDDPNALLRASRHLVAAGDDVALRRLFRRYTRALRTRGDRRGHAALAAEVSGERESSPRVVALVTSLPRSWRLGLWSPARKAAFAASLVIVTGTVAATVNALHARTARDASLQTLAYIDSSGTSLVAQMRPEEWDGRRTPVELAPEKADLSEAAARFPDRPPVPSPDARTAAWNQDAGDSTTLDIWIRTPSGTRRLTRESRDDLVTGWLPDGSALVGTSNRWSPPGDGDYDIAVFDTATGVARQVTRGTAHDHSPFVSPDGTRIAFVRESDDSPPRVCITTLDGTRNAECRLIDGQQAGDLLGWSGLTELALTVNTPGARPLVVYDWARNATRTILSPFVLRGRLSPDGRWVVASVRVDGIRGTRDWVVPLARPAQARTLAAPIARSWSVRWWTGPTDVSSLIDRLAFSSSARQLLLGVSSRLLVRPLTAQGTEVPLLAPLTWTSSDTTVALVDSTGVVRPLRAGSVTISATLAGWRSTSATLDVVGQPAKTLIGESWDASWQERWIAWGDPRPQVVTGPEGVRGMWNHGDGSYPSVAVLKRALDARDGLGVEVRLSTPLSRPKWQRLRTYLDAGIDTAALIASDQRKAPPTLGGSDAACGIDFPLSGRWAETYAALHGGIGQSVDLGQRGRTLRTGAWWTLRLQILPDGRCGVAIDGHVIWLSPEPIALDRPFRLRLGDESAGTRILHGPMEVWSGVRTDVQWMPPPRP